MKKRTYNTMLTQQGYVELECPECEDGVNFSDYTNARGGEMIPSICGYCEGKGVVDEDMLLDVNFDDNGKPHLIYKN